MAMQSEFEPVIGLEIHIQLKTHTKAYSPDANTYGELPNSAAHPVSLGHPGTLPVVNKAVVEHAIRLGLACGCNIREVNEYARKNYFYPDLPKGYQISQHLTPICTGGAISIKDADGQPKDIRITRIHMEEDTGKSIHDLDPFNTLIDLNRAGVPLLEMVSEPDIANGTEAYNYLSEVRKLVRYLDVSDGNMEEGSLRCDVNISIRKKGTKPFGTKVEVKNMNSFRNVQRAIDFECKRQEALILSGGTVVQETRTFDAVKGETTAMRTKEDAHDYRYFPEPDLPIVRVSESWKSQVASTMPPLPRELYAKFTGTFQLPDYDAAVLTENKAIALFFDRLAELSGQPKAASNWIMGPVKGYLNEQALEMEAFPISAETMAAVIQRVESGMISFSAASQKLFPALLLNPTAHPEQLARELSLIQERNEDHLQQWIAEALAAYPEKVLEYQSGKVGLLGLFMGEVMKRSGGKADPKATTQLLKEALNHP
jgi:aspartyl-tRNA(Asn)/glutamyl-tRNA(Gln) amidotransferase subunit B